jgi:hypothetical protein
MKPSFDFGDLLAFQFLGVLGAAFVCPWLTTVGLLSFFGLLFGILFFVLALPSLRIP